MTTKSLLPEFVQAHIDAATEPPDAVQRAIAERTAALPEAMMRTAHDQTVFLSILAQAMGATRILEIGVFTGYSGLALARALPADGRLVALDISKTWTAIAREHWARADVDAKVDLRLGPALEALDVLADEFGEDGFDLAYVDADKSNYEAYYEHCLALVRRNGIVALDNMLWEGEAAKPDADDETAATLHDLALKIAADTRVETCLLGIADGLLLARRR